MIAHKLRLLEGELKKGRENTESLLGYMEAKPTEANFPYLLDDLDLEHTLKTSESVLPGFATLDIVLASNIAYVLEDLKAYLQDDSRKRPHNLLMIAPPGSGKSHLVTCLSKALEIPLVIGNLSIPDSVGVLAYAANEVRNYKAQDAVPLLFLDEVDTDNKYPVVLPLLWDGEMLISNQVVKLGRCIVICAISNPKVEDQDKSRDFLSRFDAGILKVNTINSDNRRLDKVCLVTALIKRRFKNLHYISLGLLQFLSQIEVEHEVRSLEFLINLIPIDSIRTRSSSDDSTLWLKHGEQFISFSRTKNKDLCERFQTLFMHNMPMESTNPLRLHINDENRERASERWNVCARNIGLLRVRPSASSTS